MVIFTTFIFAIIFCLWASTVRVFNIPDPTRNGIMPGRNQYRYYSKRNNESLFVPQGVPQFILINGVIFKLLQIRSQHTEHFEELEFVGYKKWVLSQLLG